MGVRAISANLMRVLLSQDFDHDLLVRARPEQRIDWRQKLIEPYVDDAAPHGDDHAKVW